MKAAFVCKICGSKDLYVVVVKMTVGEHHKLMCRECGEKGYQKFLGRAEREAFEKGKASNG